MQKGKEKKQKYIFIGFIFSYTTLIIANVRNIKSKLVTFFIYIKNLRAYRQIIQEFYSFNQIEYLNLSGKRSKIVIIKQISVFIPGNTNNEDLLLKDQGSPSRLNQTGITSFKFLYCKIKYIHDINNKTPANIYPIISILQYFGIGNY
ncbi:hypothetical protein IMG5_100720 [Ichthyophthirius multifiliis]|uniref:Transmembrane protein n=1 Tax=Ichthyophthirius multifiliis TaxID=5932 RepID=G0QSE9_ICHMU|nr:hypothetical protein IMG5_100720 [Ichthyophthirius multifiliis]EGR31850.1 hypothetical protein IMG5_100720 [Ichthyophthirius multifiliis]|eukprot:XP_004035336.1 hypothetical protein IMG5_100720 [Ichthyophthirius multifiliis]